MPCGLRARWITECAGNSPWTSTRKLLPRTRCRRAAESTAAQWSISGVARLTGIHGWKLPGRDTDPAANLSLEAAWRLGEPRAQIRKLLVEMASSHLQGTGDLDWGHGFHPQLHIESSSLGLSDVLSWYRALHTDVAEDLACARHARSGCDARRMADRASAGSHGQRRRNADSSVTARAVANRRHERKRFSRGTRFCPDRGFLFFRSSGRPRRCKCRDQGGPRYIRAARLDLSGTKRCNPLAAELEFIH